MQRRTKTEPGPEAKLPWRRSNRSDRRTLEKRVALSILGVLLPILLFVTVRVEAPVSTPTETPPARSVEPPPASNAARIAAEPPRRRVQAPKTPAAPAVSPSAGERPKEVSAQAGAHVAQLEVVVVDAGSRRPAGGAWIELRHVVDPTLEASPVVHRADARGRLRLDLAPGEVYAVGWHDRAAGGPAHGVLEPGAREVVELVLEPVREVAGRIHDASTGEPIAEASVRFWTFAEEDRVLTDAAGMFRHPRFPTGFDAQQVRVEAPGYGATVRYLEVTSDGAWSLASPTSETASATGTGGTPWLEIALVPELRIEGRVVDRSGAPLSDVDVSAEGYYHILPSVASRDGATGATGEDGRFLLQGLRSDVSHSLLLRAHGRADHTLEVSVGGATHVDVGDLVIDPEALLSGVVLDGEGRPARDIVVRLTPREPAEDEPSETTGTLDVRARLQGKEWTARTSPEGTFVFDGLPVARYRLVVVRDAAPLVETDVEAADLGNPRGLVLELPPESFALTGEVRDERGPLVGARVSVRRFGEVCEVTTDQDGVFRVSGLDDGASYELEATLARKGDVLRATATVWAFEAPVLVLEETTNQTLASARRR